jgi:hypothetical protein
MCSVGEFVLHIFHEDTQNDIHDGKRKSRNYFLVSARMLKSINCCWLKGSNLVKFCIIDNLIKYNVFEPHETLGIIVCAIPIYIGKTKH